MHIVGDVDRLVWRMARQLDAIAPRTGRAACSAIVDAALPRAEAIFSRSALPGYRDALGQTTFDPVHADQYAMFLWLCSNEAFHHGDTALAADFYNLNRALNAIVCMWDTKMPKTFLWIHAVGTMLGKAEYGERFVAYHNVTVGTDRGERPRFGTGTILFAGAKVVGAAAIGERSVISLNSVVIAETIAPNSLVAGRSPDLLVKPRRRWLFSDYFLDDPAPSA